MNYHIFFTGLASTPNSVGLINSSTGEKIHEISCTRVTGKKTREAYTKYNNIIKTKYKSLLND